MISRTRGEPSVLLRHHLPSNPHKKVSTRVTELKIKISELKNTQEWFNSRLDEAEQISYLEDKAMEMNKTDQGEKVNILKTHLRQLQVKS